MKDVLEKLPRHFHRSWDNCSVNEVFHSVSAKHDKILLKELAHLPTDPALLSFIEKNSVQLYQQV
jgi:hypothetical protein